MKSINFITIVKAVLFIGFWLTLTGICSRVFSIPLPLFMESPALTEIWYRLGPFLSMVVVSLLFVFLLDKNIKVRMFPERADVSILSGLVFGAIWVGGTFGLLLITDSVVLSGPKTIPDAIFWLIAVLMLVLTQEYLLRGYLFSLLRKSYGGFVAIIVTSVLYVLLSPSVLEASSLAILIALAEGVMLGMLRVYTGGILSPLLAHLLWAGFGSLILGTVPTGLYSPSMWETVLTGAEPVTGGALMFSGSALCLLVIVILIDLSGILMNDKRTRLAATLEE
ncbi:MAG: CPBP family intramembrane metalloprotease [Clostridiales Family XIII bacterium]|jgi:membrane protease YdiL (CAAX protease family)|nr:CPBP family intramembrane metalloprotease [Clostridiales Family XIII bacterium]